MSRVDLETRVRSWESGSAGADNPLVITPRDLAEKGMVLHVHQLGKRVILMPATVDDLPVITQTPARFTEERAARAEASLQEMTHNRDFWREGATAAGEHGTEMERVAGLLADALEEIWGDSHTATCQLCGSAVGAVRPHFEHCAVRTALLAYVAAGGEIRADLDEEGGEA